MITGRNRTKWTDFVLNCPFLDSWLNVRTSRCINAMREMKNSNNLEKDIDELVKKHDDVIDGYEVNNEGICVCDDRVIYNIKFKTLG